jgi:hypothetical protein
VGLSDASGRPADVDVDVRTRDNPALDWGTIVVYSCEDSCTASVSTIDYIEEFVWVQLHPYSF